MIFPKRITDINKALKIAGYEGYKLVRGKGYFYFIGNDSMFWETSSVYVYRLDELTIQQWVDNFEILKTEYER